MPSTKSVERKIQRVEGFWVSLLHENGADIRSDKQAIPQYGFERMANGEQTVNQWIATRFRKTYPGFKVNVMAADGSTCFGNTKLKTVRDSYD